MQGGQFFIQLGLQHPQQRLLAGDLDLTDAVLIDNSSLALTHLVCAGAFTWIKKKLTGVSLQGRQQIVDEQLPWLEEAGCQGLPQMQDRLSTRSGAPNLVLIAVILYQQSCRALCSDSSLRVTLHRACT